MASQSRIVACTNSDCSQCNDEYVVWADIEGRFYDWPQLTCSVCGHEAKTVSEGDN